MNGKNHFLISVLKSGIRILGGILTIAFNSISMLAIFLVVAELLGMLEEVVDDRK